jgi:hypothetical protein
LDDEIREKKHNIFKRKKNIIWLEHSG